jgi:hypothetical protein
MVGRAPDAERFIIHEHPVRLADIPAGEKVFFGIRDPLARFVSAFTSRWRRGRPRYDVAWTPIQQQVFPRFPDPKAAAEALSAGDPEIRRLAISLMEDMLLAAPLSYWLRSEQLLRERLSDIIAILVQEELAGDFEQLKATLGLPPHIRLPDDPVESHRGAPSAPTRLSDVAVCKLEAWYGVDRELYAAARVARDEIRRRA